jgi:hypothetical protein
MPQDNDQFRKQTDATEDKESGRTHADKPGKQAEPTGDNRRAGDQDGNRSDGGSKSPGADEPDFP